MNESIQFDEFVKILWEHTNNKKANESVLMNEDHLKALFRGTQKFI